MFLKELQIQVGAKVIRELKFHKGLNLIVDETPSEKRQETGNNVGKTSVIRLIDFCLGGNGNNIYKDPEFRDKNNTVIEKFLKENNVIISLTLTENLDDENAEQITIHKNFQGYSNKIQEVNDEKIRNNDDFEKKLNKLIFKSENERPSFRQIIAKNIRDEKTRLVNTLRVLHTTTKQEEYEALYLFWLGIDTDTAHRKQKLGELRRSEERVLNKLRKEFSLSEIEQALEVITRDINERQKEKDRTKLNENYQKELSRLNEIKKEITQLSSDIGRFSLRRDLIVECTEELKKEVANIDTKSLESVYKNAKKFIPEMNKKFEELVTFHNNMIKEKINYIQKELPQITKTLSGLQSKQQQIMEEGKVLSQSISNSTSAQHLEKLIIEINKLFEQKGKYEEKRTLWKSISEKIEQIDTELGKLNQGIANKETLINDKVKEFNKYFSKLSEELYGEKFILSVEKTERAFELKISSIDGNLGTGKKKGQIAAFDFAYVQYADENEIPCLHFILHDQMENVHDNQLYTLEQIANRSNCQLVLPVLRDKLPSDFDINKYAIVKLSQKDKLFKVN